MRDEQALPGERADLAAAIRAWCDARDPAGPDVELSDEAAVLIAAASVDDVSRVVIANRRAAGREIATVGGFARLRRVADEYDELTIALRTRRPAPAQLVLRSRLAAVTRSLEAMRSAFLFSSAHHATRVRAIRRDRRDGLHLDLEQREALFEALRRTPARRGRVEAGSPAQAALSAAAESVATLWPGGQRPRNRLQVLRAPLQARSLGFQPAVFDDEYDTLLFVAGRSRDVIAGSAAWRSDHYTVYRAQLDVDEELAQIALDTVALRDLRAELAALERYAQPDARAEIHSRTMALEPVWEQLVDRVAALHRIADAMIGADSRLRSLTASHRTLTLDSRIDELIGRSGSREISAANTRHVGDQVNEGAAVLDGYRAALASDVAALSQRRTR